MYACVYICGLCILKCSQETRTEELELLKFLSSMDFILEHIKRSQVCSYESS